MENKAQLLEFLNNVIAKNNMLEWMEIKFIDAGMNYLTAEMPITSKVHQPLGLLHGGASAALAESVGSTASYLLIDANKYNAMGIDLQINHLRSKREGKIRATANLLHQGKTIHLWEIKITDEENNLIAHAKLTNIIRAL